MLYQYKKGTVDDWLCFYGTAEVLFGMPAYFLFLNAARYTLSCV